MIGSANSLFVLQRYGGISLAKVNLVIYVGNMPI